ncbi:MAG: PDZ domain-containing protein [Bacteroidota bacterium]
MERILKLLILLLFGGLCVCATGQNLGRRVFLGIRMENLTDDARTLMGIEGKNGVLISEVLPNSTAVNAGFKKGDVLSSINGIPVESTQHLLTELARYSSGDAFSYELIRQKKSKSGKSVFTPFPDEKYSGLKTIYTQSKSAIGDQRIILTKTDKPEKQPLVVFIGGIGCYSLDSPFDTTRSEIQLLNYLSRSGFACARLEKPGMGDNAGHCKSCKEVSFMEESDSYVASVEELKKRPDIDPERVYIIGHSMGGVFAPLVAQKTAIKGIISYGTIGSSFIEYLAKTRRTIAEAYQMNPIETDQMIKDFCACSALYFAENKTTEEAGASNEVCREYLGIFDLRSRAYNSQLYALNLPEEWSRYKGKSLFLWGSSDYVASREDHEILDKTVNYYHKGNSTFKIVENTDHGMNKARSFSEARLGTGMYNPEAAKVMLSWLKETEA